MKSCLDIKCARTTPVTAKGHRGDTPPHASEPRIPYVLARGFWNASPVSRDRRKALKMRQHLKAGTRDADTHPVTFAFL